MYNCSSYYRQKKDSDSIATDSLGVTLKAEDITFEGEKNSNNQTEVSSPESSHGKSQQQPATRREEKAARKPTYEEVYF